MSIRTPLLRDLGSLNIIATRIRSESRIAPWEIGVYKRQDLFWCILLPFLKSKVSLPSEEYSNSVQFLLSEDITDLDVKKAIENFNPFLNRHAYFYNGILKKLVKVLQKLIENHMKDENNENNFKNHNLSSPGRKTLLQAASLTLHCKVVVIVEKETEDFSPRFDSPSIEYYPEEDIPGSCEWDSQITLYYKDVDTADYSNLSFGLLKHIGNDLQKKAFTKILSNILPRRKDVLKILNLPDVRTNFIVSLLKEELFDEIRVLYQQPPHVLTKLSEAGFDTDPTKRESEYEPERNAFYYALRADEVDILVLLYKYAAQALHWTENCPRNPNAAVIESLKDLGQVLTRTRQVYKRSHKKESKGIVRIEELIELHSFQFDVCQSFLHIRHKVKNTETIEDSLFETEKRKDILLTILSAYKDRFFSDVFAESRSTCISFERYQKYINYFHTLDVMAALFFFDHSYSLKERLSLSPGSYEKIETAFVKLVFVCKEYFGIPTSEIANPSTSKSPKVLNKEQLQELLFVSAFLARQYFHEELKCFTNYIREIEISKENVVKGLPAAELHSLKTEPIIKDDIYLFRLKYYIKLALEVNIEADNRLGIWVIQRSFQVLGEALKPAVDEPLTTMKSFVLSCFPEEISKQLRKIRNLLCNVELSQFSCQIDTEKSVFVFKQLKEFLQKFNDALAYVLDIQNCRAEMFICASRLNTIKNYYTHSDKASKRLTPVATASDQTSNLNPILFMKNKLKKLKEPVKQMEQNLKALKQNMQKISQTMFHICEAHFQNHFCWLENVSKKLGPHKVEDIEHRLQCVKLLLVFFVEEVGTDIVKEKFMCRIEKLNLKFSESDSETIKSKSVTSQDNVRCFVDSALKSLKKLKNEILQSLKMPKMDENTCEYNALKTCSTRVVNEYKQQLCGKYFISDEEQYEIISEVPEKYKKHHDALISIRKSLKDGPKLPSEDVTELLKELDIPQKKHKKLQEKYEASDAETFEIMTDHYGKLLNSLAESAIDKNFCKIVGRKFSLSDKTRTVLENIVKGKPKSCKSTALIFFNNRVQNLKDILINDHHDIEYLWKNAKSTDTKRFIHDKIVRLYLEDLQLQAAVEFLLRDCMVVLKKYQIANLEYLWLKTNRLFNGINLKNVLGHGNPLFEAVVMFLDPADLPNEIVAKVLELINDSEAINAICQIRNRTSCDFDQFIKLMNDNETRHNEDIENLKSVVRSCGKWEEYAGLISRAPPDFPLK